MPASVCELLRHPNFILRHMCGGQQSKGFSGRVNAKSTVEILPCSDPLQSFNLQFITVHCSLCVWLKWNNGKRKQTLGSAIFQLLTKVLDIFLCHLMLISLSTTRRLEFKEQIWLCRTYSTSIETSPLKNQRTRLRCFLQFVYHWAHRRSLSCVEISLAVQT